MKAEDQDQTQVLDFTSTDARVRIMFDWSVEEREGDEPIVSLIALRDDDSRFPGAYRLKLSIAQARQVGRSMGMAEARARSLNTTRLQAQDAVGSCAARGGLESKVQSDDILDQILNKARTALAGGFGVLSTGEKLAVALVLNRPDWLASMHYTIGEAMTRVGADWLARVPAAERVLRDEAGAASGAEANGSTVGDDAR